MMKIPHTMMIHHLTFSALLWVGRSSSAVLSLCLFSVVACRCKEEWIFCENNSTFQLMGVCPDILTLRGAVLSSRGKKFKRAF